MSANPEYLVYIEVKTVFGQSLVLEAKKYRAKRQGKGEGSLY